MDLCFDIITLFMGSNFSISSISSPKKWILYAWSVWAGNISMVSPIILNLPCLKSSARDLEYRLWTNLFRRVVLE